MDKELEKAAGIHALQCHSKKASVATLAASKYDFIAGAKWMLEHPTGGELFYVLNKGADLGRKNAIDKACEFFYHRMNDVGDVEFRDIENFINDFKKYSEDK